MNNDIRTILFIMLIIVGAAYLFFYLQKRKNNTHKDITYKIVFIICLFLIAIPLFLSSF